MVQDCMWLACFSVLGHVIVAAILPIVSGESAMAIRDLNDPVAEMHRINPEGRTKSLGLSAAAGILEMVLALAVAGVLAGGMAMLGPASIWHGEQPPMYAEFQSAV